MSGSTPVPNPSAANAPRDPVRPSTDRSANLRLALVLASIAAAFFAGVVLKYVFFPVP
jgi:hypothetical protein